MLRHLEKMTRCFKAPIFALVNIVMISVTFSTLRANENYASLRKMRGGEDNEPEIDLGYRLQVTSYKLDVTYNL
jgi:hypothetical protein